MQRRDGDECAMAGSRGEATAAELEMALQRRYSVKAGRPKNAGSRRRRRAAERAGGSSTNKKRILGATPPQKKTGVGVLKSLTQMRDDSTNGGPGEIPQARTSQVRSEQRRTEATRACNDGNRGCEGAAGSTGAPDVSAARLAGRLRGLTDDKIPGSGKANQAAADERTRQETTWDEASGSREPAAVSAVGRNRTENYRANETVEYHSNGDRSCGGNPQLEADRARFRRLKSDALYDIGDELEVEAKKGTEWETKLSASAAAFVPRVRPVAAKPMPLAEGLRLAKESWKKSRCGRAEEMHTGGRRVITFLDICCGIGGFTLAATMMNGVDGNVWKGEGGVDFCRSLKEYWEQNFSHPFECADVTDSEVQNRLVRKYRSIVLGLLSGPCQPYCKSGNKRKGDARVDVMRAGVAIYLRIRPMCFVLENVDSFEKCKWEPVWEQELRPQIEGAGYHVAVVRSNAKHGLVPMNRLRLWVVCTLYPRTGKLERRLAQMAAMGEVKLSEWYSELKYVRHRPCRGGPAVFDARRKAHPCFLTHCMEDVNLDKYKLRKGDPVHPREATLLSLRRKKQMCGLPPGFALPPKGKRCRLPECCGGKSYPKDLLGVGLGNVVIAPQALVILRNLELPPDVGTAVDQETGGHS